MDDQHSKEAVGRRLRELMAEMQLTIAELGEAGESNKENAKHWLYGNQYPTLRQVRALAEFFDVNPLWIVYGWEPKRPYPPNDPRLRARRRRQ